VPVETVAALPVWGVKDSGGDIAYTRAVLAAGKNVMVGAERTMVAAIGGGAAGAIAGLANLLTEHLVAAAAAARAGELDTAAARLAPALRFQSRLLAACQTSPVEWISIAKRLVGRRSGVYLGDVRPPAPRAPDGPEDELATELEAALAQLAEAR
jgi:4-hydroxy-tetrahydrodipicolinate synthase